MHVKTITHFILVLALLLPGLGVGAEQPYSDGAALNGVTEGKGLFLVDLAEPRKTALYLDIIEGTHAGMLRQGVKPDFVVVYIGPTVRFLTTRPDEVLEMEYAEVLADIQASIRALKALGVRQEVCAIANRVFGIDNATMPPELTIVGNGFISLIGWQTQGYKLVPIY